MNCPRHLTIDRDYGRVVVHSFGVLLWVDTREFGRHMATMELEDLRHSIGWFIHVYIEWTMWPAGIRRRSHPQDYDLQKRTEDLE